MISETFTVGPKSPYDNESASLAAFSVKFEIVLPV